MNDVAQHCTTEKLARGCARLGFSLSAQQQQRLWRHLRLLVKCNRALNLTALHNLDDMVTRHLLDSLTIARFVRGESVLDIGSGGGFPGLPLAIVQPHLQVTLLDSRGKRVEFLRYACAALKLDNVRVVAERVENYRSAQKFDTLTTRAFASVADTLALSAALHHPGGRLLAMKGRLPKAEIARLGVALRARLTVQKLAVPFLQAERHLLIVELGESH